MAKNLDDLIQRGIPYGEAKARLAGSGVATPAALTSPASVSATYTQTEVQHIRDDVANLRTTVANLLAFINAGG